MKSSSRSARTWSIDRRQLPIAVMIAIPALGFGYASWRYLRLHFTDQQTQCTVLGRTYSGDSGGTLDVVTVQVKHVVGRDTHTGEADVTVRTGNAEDASRYFDGKQVPCKYASGSPHVITLEPPRWFHVIGFAAASAFFLYLVAKTLWQAPRKRPSPF